MTQFRIRVMASNHNSNSNSNSSNLTANANADAETHSPTAAAASPSSACGGVNVSSNSNTSSSSIGIGSWMPSFQFPLQTLPSSHSQQQMQSQQQLHPPGLPPLQIPGHFMVGQGSPGDGMRNSLSEPVPVFPFGDAEHASSGEQGDNVIMQDDDDDDGDDMNLVTTLSTTSSMTSNTLSPPPSIDAETQANMELWQEEAKSRQMFRYREWMEMLAAQQKQQQQQQQQQRNNSNSTNGRNANNANTATTRWMHQSSTAWWRCQGQLAVWNDLPLGDGQHPPKATAALPPGTLVYATELYTWKGKQHAPERVVALTSHNNDKDASAGASAGVGDNDHSQSDKEIVVPYNFADFSKQRGTAWILKITSPFQGYCCLSLDGYMLMLPGDSMAPFVADAAVGDVGVGGATTTPSIPPSISSPSLPWYWRVMCPAGAFVRDGIELNDRHVTTLPFGTLVQVTRQCVNAAGLPRLQIVANVYDEKDHNNHETDGSDDHNDMALSSSSSSLYRRVKGWCSLALNPLSGQRGPILQPLPLTKPAVYKIVATQGAVIRQGIDLTSPAVGHAPYGVWVTVLEQAFTDFPADRAVARLRLASGGWISTRLNHSAPRDTPIVEFVKEDAAFDPARPALFHYRAQKQAVVSAQNASAQQEMGTDTSQGCFETGNRRRYNLYMTNPNGAQSSMAGAVASTVSDSSITTNAGISGNSTGAGAGLSLAKTTCLLCLESDRDATLLHGETGHIVCCLQCARILQAQRAPCPVCRLPIERVIKHYYG